MKTFKRVLNDYLMGAAMLFDFAGVFYVRHRPMVKQRTPYDALVADGDAISGDAQRAFARLQKHYAPTHS